MKIAFPARAHQPHYADHVDQAFANDVINGMSRHQKRLPSKYLYDAKGSELFERITDLPEYYLYRAEKSIITQQGSEFFSHRGNSAIDVIELGSGNGEKTILLLQAMLSAGQQPHYHPVDISESALAGLTETLASEFPSVPINGVHADYHDLLRDVGQLGEQAHRAILFLGSNIGNYNSTDSNQLLAGLHAVLKAGDNLLIGFDLRKDYQRMIAAYNDSQGLTAEFNLNALTRMNRELGSDFDLTSFYHYEIFNPLDGAMQSFLVSTEQQSVYFSEIGFSVSFDRNEAIYMESSRKYTLREIETLARDNGFKVVRNFTDDNEDFVDSLWQRL